MFIVKNINSSYSGFYKVDIIFVVFGIRIEIESMIIWDVKINYSFDVDVCFVEFIACV